MSHKELQNAILKLSTDVDYRKEVSTAPEKLHKDYQLDESQLEVFFVEGIKSGPSEMAGTRICCCC